MKFLIVLTFFSLLFYSLAQGVENHSFVGALSGKGIPTIPLKLTFQVDEQGIVRGESNMNFLTSESTVSVIQGTYDFKKQQLSFKETKNLSTKSDADESEFCYIEVQEVKVKLHTDKQMIRSSFEGRYPNGESCASGQLYLVPIQAHEILDSVFRMDESSIDEIQKNVAVEEKSFQSAFGLEPIVIQSTSKNISLEIYDGYKEDGDIVWVSTSTVKTRKKVVLKKDKRILKFNGVPESFTIKICAENIGETAPNTSHVVLNAGGIHQYIIHLDKNKCQEIQIHR